MEILTFKESVDKVAESVKGILDKYFEGVPYNTSIEPYGNIINGVIDYTDFKPEDEVRRDLEAQIPYFKMEINRELSLSALWDIISMVDDKIPSIYVEEGDTMRETSFGAILQEVISDYKA